MTTVELSDEAVAVLDRIVALRGLDRGQALAEALGVEARIAETIKGGGTVLVGKKGNYEELLIGRHA